MESDFIFPPLKKGFYLSNNYSCMQKAAKELNDFLRIEILCNLIPFHCCGKIYF